MRNVVQLRARAAAYPEPMYIRGTTVLISLGLWFAIVVIGWEIFRP